jgi:transcriptional regulator with XRE-family HTH domain
MTNDQDSPSREQQALRQLGERLTQARRAAGLSQATLASNVGLSESSIRNWESGRSWPGSDSVLSLCRHLAVSSDWLLGLRASPTGLPIGQVIVDLGVLERLESASTARQVETLLDWDPHPLHYGFYVPEMPKIVSPKEGASISASVIAKLDGDYRPVVRKWRKKIGALRD